MVVIGLLFAGELLGREVMVHAGIGITPQTVLDADLTTQALGNTCSMLVRGTAPVVKACPSMTSGSSNNTGPTSRSRRCYLDACKKSQQDGAELRPAN
jgi:hypothetical protein